MTSRINRRRLIRTTLAVAAAGLMSSRSVAQHEEQTQGAGMSLVDVDLPSPAQMRGGWAAFAAVLASRGWGRDAYAEPDQWLYHDGGGNWACLRFVEKDKVVLLGHDHE